MSMYMATKRSKAEKQEWRQEFAKKLDNLFSTYKKFLVIDVDNVQSAQLNQVRRLLRGEAELLFGNKLLINRYIERTGNDQLKKMSEHIKKNVGLVFTNGDLTKVTEAFGNSKRKAAAKANQVAPDSVVIEPQQTMLDPGQTQFFAALKIQTKITKNKIEITHPVNLIQKGDLVTPNQAALLAKLDIVPFFYQVQPLTIYDNGMILDAGILSVTDEEMEETWNKCIGQFTALALGAGVPVLPAVPHVVADTLKTLLGVAVEAGVSGIPEVDKVKALVG